MEKPRPVSRVKILSNLSRRASESLRAAVDALGPVRGSEVQAAQRTVLKVVLSLEGSGRLVVPGTRRETSRSFS